MVAKLDRWKFFDITHHDHTYMNPLGSDKLDELVDLLDLSPRSRVLDIACGKAEPLLRIAERYDIAGVGVDLSPRCIQAARVRTRERAPQSDLTFLELDGAQFTAERETFDLAMCLGASWVFGGHRETLRALTRFLRPGGLVLAGEPFWHREPSPDYLAAAGMTADTFATHAGNVEIGEAEGLIPLYTLVSSTDDWDRYECLQWRATELYAASHPDDPDVPELLEKKRRTRSIYLRYGRDTLGWAVYLFRKP